MIAQLFSRDKSLSLIFLCFGAFVLTPPTLHKNHHFPLCLPSLLLQCYASRGYALHTVVLLCFCPPGLCQPPFLLCLLWHCHMYLGKGWEQLSAGRPFTIRLISIFQMLTSGRTKQNSSSTPQLSLHEYLVDFIYRTLIHAQNQSPRLPMRTSGPTFPTPSISVLNLIASVMATAIKCYCSRVALRVQKRAILWTDS